MSEKRFHIVYHEGHGIRLNIDTMDTIDRVQVSPYGSPSPLILWSANIDLIHRESGHRFARE